MERARCSSCRVLPLRCLAQCRDMRWCPPASSRKGPLQRAPLRAAPLSVWPTFPATALGVLVKLLDRQCASAWASTLARPSPEPCSLHHISDIVQNPSTPHATRQAPGPCRNPRLYRRCDLSTSLMGQVARNEMLVPIIACSAGRIRKSRGACDLKSRVHRRPRFV